MCGVRTFTIASLGRFQEYNPVLLTKVIVLYIRSSEFVVLLR